MLTCFSGSWSLIFREYWYEALQPTIFCLGLYIFGMIFANIVKYCISRNFSMFNLKIEYQILAICNSCLFYSKTHYIQTGCNVLASFRMSELDPRWNFNLYGNLWLFHEGCLLKALVCFKYHRKIVNFIRLLYRILHTRYCVLNDHLSKFISTLV